MGSNASFNVTGSMNGSGNSGYGGSLLGSFNQNNTQNAASFGSSGTGSNSFNATGGSYNASFSTNMGGNGSVWLWYFIDF